MQAKRIVIMGPSGAGKSTLARRIGVRLDLMAGPPSPVSGAGRHIRRYVHHYPVRRLQVLGTSFHAPQLVSWNEWCAKRADRAPPMRFIG